MEHNGINYVETAGNPDYPVALVWEGSRYELIGYNAETDCYLTMRENRYHVFRPAFVAVSEKVYEGGG